MARNDSLHLLSIDSTTAGADARRALDLSSDALIECSVQAARDGAPLAIVSSAASLDLYSTAADHRAAFRPLLQKLWSIGLPCSASFRSVRARELRGLDAARHLLRQAAGLPGCEPGDQALPAIDAAYLRARSAGTLSPELEGLFRLALGTAARSLTETELSAPTSTRASRELEALGAERIVEEELVAFRMTSVANDTTPAAPQHPDTLVPRPSLTSSMPPQSFRLGVRASLVAPKSGVISILPSYSASEPGSSVRLRVAPDATGLTKRRAGS